MPTLTPYMNISLEILLGSFLELFPSRKEKNASKNYFPLYFSCLIRFFFSFSFPNLFSPLELLISVIVITKLLVCCEISLI